MLCMFLEFNLWMDALDGRYHAKQRADGVMFPKKDRIEGSPSLSLPPHGAPGWAVDKDWPRQDRQDLGERMTPFPIAHVMSSFCMHTNHYRF